MCDAAIYGTDRYFGFPGDLVLSFETDWKREQNTDHDVLCVHTHRLDIGSYDLREYHPSIYGSNVMTGGDVTASIVTNYEIWHLASVSQETE